MAPDLLHAESASPLTITCAPDLTEPEKSTWILGQDQLLCRSTTDLLVTGDKIKVATVQVATWTVVDNGDLRITTSAGAAQGGEALLRKLLNSIAYTNPAGQFAVSPGLTRKVKTTIVACSARGTVGATNMTSTCTRTISFTGQPPTFATVSVEPGGKQELRLATSATTSNLTCSIVAPGPTAGRLVNGAGTTISSFGISEVKLATDTGAASTVFYLNTDVNAAADPITLEVTDNSAGIVLGRVVVPVVMSLGKSLSIIGNPLLSITPSDKATTTYTAVITGPDNISAIATILPWSGNPTDPSRVPPGISVVTGKLINGLTDIPISFDWNALGTSTTVDGVTTTTYPSYLRFRLSITTDNSNNTVQQPFCIRVMSAGTPAFVAPPSARN